MEVSWNKFKVVRIYWVSSHQSESIINEPFEIVYGTISSNGQPETLRCSNLDKLY